MENRIVPTYRVDEIDHGHNARETTASLHEVGDSKHLSEPASRYGLSQHGVEVAVPSVSAHPV